MLLTISTAGQLLDLFTPGCPERGVSEVAAELEVSKSKAHALLASLTQVGLLRRMQGGRYRLGWRLLSLQRVLDETAEFPRLARPVMAAVRRRLDETVHLATLDDGLTIYIDRIQGSRSPALGMSRAGAVLPAHCSAVGKALLAPLSEPELSAVLTRHGLPALTANTITDALELRRQLLDVRRLGYATEYEEAVTGVSCVGAPIVTSGPRVVAAISISAPSGRLDAHRDLYTRTIVQAAAGISRALRAAGEHAAYSETELAAAC